MERLAIVERGDRNQHGHLLARAENIVHRGWKPLLHFNTGGFMLRLTSGVLLLPVAFRGTPGGASGAGAAWLLRVERLGDSIVSAGLRFFSGAALPVLVSSPAGLAVRRVHS